MKSSFGIFLFLLLQVFVLTDQSIMAQDAGDCITDSSLLNSNQVKPLVLIQDRVIPEAVGREFEKDTTEKELFKLSAVSRFKDTHLSKYFTKAQVKELLQSLAQSISGFGYSEFGHPADLDHGHLLFNQEGQPFAILYHSQEWEDDFKPGTRFSSLDRYQRNWLQWTQQPGKIENAREYVISPFKRFLIGIGLIGNDELKYGVRRYGTGVGQELLNEEKLGQKIRRSPKGFTDSQEFEFVRVSCEGVSESVKNTETNIFQLSRPGNGALCVSLGLPETQVKAYARFVQDDVKRSSPLKSDQDFASRVTHAYEIYDQVLSDLDR